MTTAKTDFNPYSVVLEITSNYNFFYARSSNGWDVYGVLMTGEGAAICSCPAGTNGVDCKHRQAALMRYTYVTPSEDEDTGQLNWAA